MRHSLVRNLFFLALVSILPLTASCKKKDPSGKSKTSEAYKEIEKTFDDSEPAPSDRKPVEGVDPSELDSDDAKRFEDFADTLPSPCGKAHSLRTSRNTDTDCKRAPFAVEYVFELIKDGASDDEIKELYALRFKEQKAVQLSYDPAMPHVGPTDAPVKIAEFFDYGCPACKMMKPAIEEALVGYETDVVLYYKMFPLSGHPDSPYAARGVLAANAQGKFKEMHDLLFEDQHAHKPEQVRELAEKLGLDMAKYDADYIALQPLVERDRQEGVKVGVTGTPTIYINGIPYEGPSHPKYIKMWIDEELAKAR